MTAPSKLCSISLAGFRAYLDEQTIDLRSGQSLVVFAPNGKGKSSLVDATEFVFSPTGTVSRLGEKRSPTQGGREALFHHDADTRGIIPYVQIKVKTSGNELTFKRNAKSPEPFPQELNGLIESLKVSFVIRGFELRRFVEDEKPQERYESVARWFGFTSLLRSQNSLRTLRIELKRKIDDRSGIQFLDSECSKLTSRQIPQWNEAKIIEWYLSKFITPLDPKINITSLSEVASFRNTIQERANKEQKAPNLDAQKNLRSTLETIVAAPIGKQNLLEEYAASLEETTKLKLECDEAKSRSASAIFNDVWTVAEKVFQDLNESHDNCPVCEAPFLNSPHKTKEGVHLNLKVKLDTLAEVRKAETSFTKSTLVANSKFNKLNEQIAATQVVCSSLGMSEATESISAIKEKLASSDLDVRKFAIKEAAEALLGLHTQIKSEIERLEQGPKGTPWQDALNTIDRVLELKAKVDFEVKRKQALHSIHSQIVSQSNLVNQEVKRYVDGLIGALTNLTNFFYKEIQCGADRVPHIHLVLPPEDRQIQHALELQIDFAENRKGVPPSGYLSDSQVHTLALSLRFAAISLFNKSFPFTVLDDVVTSYDSDFRSAIAAVLAKHFTDHQMIVVTHDDQFFNQLKEHLAESTWLFKRINKLEANFGPKYADHRVLDKQIEDDHNEGRQAANAVRQAEEDWLTDICRDFGVNVRIREVNHPYKYSRAELAAALHGFLKDIRRTPPELAEYQNPFLVALQKGTIENMGSHFSDNPHATSSLGDEIRRWAHFKEFRNHFACPSCKKKRFTRPETLRIPVCKSCQTPFAFAAPVMA